MLQQLSVAGQRCWYDIKKYDMSLDFPLDVECLVGMERGEGRRAVCVIFSPSFLLIKPTRAR